VAIVGFEYARSVLVSFRAGKPVYAAAVMGVGMMLLVALLYGAWLPRIPAIRLSTRVADVLRAEGATQPGDAIMIDFKEPSLAFYQGGTIREESRNNYLTEETRTAFWPPWIVMTRRIWDGLPHQVQSKWDVVAGERGWWYASKGRPVEVLVIRKRYSAGPLEIDADHAKMPTHP
jgi:hypothetical protein